MSILLPKTRTSGGGSLSPLVPSRDVFIAVMGPTGVGKTTFINKASDSNLRVGNTLMSCTDKIDHSKPFTLDDCLVTLVDTPGFDDTTKSDADVLTVVADYLASEYQNKRVLHGIIYMHRISDNRISGSAFRNIRFFRDLCGPDALSNTVVVTNMWSGVDSAVGARREEELKGKDMYLKPVVAAGGKVLRHDNTPASAHRIIRELLRTTPRPLQLQRELVDEGKRVFETAAGKTLLQDLATLEAEHHKEKQELEADLKDALKRHDEESKAEIEEAQKRLAEQEAKLEEAKRKLEEYQILAARREAELLDEQREEVEAEAAAAARGTDETQRTLLPLSAQHREDVVGSGNGNGNGVGNMRTDEDSDLPDLPKKKRRSTLSRILHASGLHKLFAPLCCCFRPSKDID